jgi:PIN domain nuclease of toxin-antitoxin system
MNLLLDTHAFLWFVEENAKHYIIETHLTVCFSRNHKLRDFA